MSEILDLVVEHFLNIFSFNRSQDFYPFYGYKF